MIEKKYCPIKALATSISPKVDIPVGDTIKSWSPCDSDCGWWDQNRCVIERIGSIGYFLERIADTAEWHRYNGKN